MGAIGTRCMARNARYVGDYRADRWGTRFPVFSRPLGGRLLRLLVVVLISLLRLLLLCWLLSLLLHWLRLLLALLLIWTTLQCHIANPYC